MTTNNNHQILPAFYFRVSFSGLKDFTEADSSFESVNGIEGIFASEPGKLNEQGADNVFQPLVLKRAVMHPQHSPLRKWAIACMNTQRRATLPEIRLEILSEDQNPLVTVVLKEVSLHGWKLGELHAGQNNLLMEEISFNYKAIEIN